MIGKATVTVILASLNQTYAGSARTVTATTSPANLPVTIAYDGETTPPTDAGSYTVVATINDANYEGIASGTLVTAKAAATAAPLPLCERYTLTTTTGTRTCSAKPPSYVADQSFGTVCATGTPLREVANSGCLTMVSRNAYHCIPFAPLLRLRARQGKPGR